MQATEDKKTVSVDKKPDSERPQTAKRGGKDNKRGRGRGNARGGRTEGERTGDQEGARGGKAARPREQDKDSWVYKYHNMERPVPEKIVVTAETVIPALPAKD